MDVRTTHRDLLQRIIARTLRRGGDFAEVYVEDREGLGLRLEDGRIEATSGGREAGAAVRLLTGERTYYAYSDGVDEAALTAAADAVAAAMSGGGAGPSVIMLGDVRSAPHKHPVKVPPESVIIARKAELLRAGDDTARSAGAEIAQATVGYGDSRRRVLIANSLGECVYDDRTSVRFTVQVVARRGEIIQTGLETLGGSAGFELVDEAAARGVAATAAAKALAMLDSRSAPVGAMPVVLANGLDSPHIFLARSMRSISRIMSPTLNRGIPDCLVPSMSPTPRISISSSAILNPSVVFSIMRSLFVASSVLREDVTRRHFDACTPLPTRPRS